MRAMKDSKVKWLGVIPLEWKVERVKHGFIRKKAEAHQDNPIVLSLARTGVRERDISNNEGQIAESYYNYNPVDVDDLLINPMDLYSGANCSISKISGVISPAYVNLRYREGYNPHYYDYYFKLQYWLMAFFAHGKGVSYENRWTLNAETLMNYPIIVPTECEQRKIVDYLDTKCSKIDEIIEKQQAIIDSLIEYKKSFINEQIILNESGTKIRLKNLIVKVQSGLSAVSGADNGIESGNYVLRTSAVSSGEYKNEEVKPVMTNCIDRLVCPLEDDTLVVSRMNTAKMVGYAAYIDKADENYYLPDKLWKVIVDREKAYTKYLWYAINSPVVHDQYASIATGTSDSMINISISDFTNARISLPDIDTQKACVSMIDKRVMNIEDQITIKRKLIDKLQEYKKSLIYEVVTGKKEV